MWCGQCSEAWIYSSPVETFVEPMGMSGLGSSLFTSASGLETESHVPLFWRESTSVIVALCVWLGKHSIVNLVAQSRGKARSEHRNFFSSSIVAIALLLNSVLYRLKTWQSEHDRNNI
jgi:tellurite resistance protein TehA-like permease